jgi:hypothetical protein
MSNPLAIAAVTSTLYNLLDQGFNTDPAFAALTGLSGIVISAKPPDKARAGNEARNQVNLFLYSVGVNGTWRNQDMPRQVRPGETGVPPLPLDLLYLLTTYGANDDDAVGHRLLGWAMRLLHDMPVLDPAAIRVAVPNNDLHNQIERVRITQSTLSAEETSKLWTAFQTNYRTSATYQASVVLIESTRATRTPLPVLRRGEDDRGPVVQANMLPPFPTLEEVGFADSQPVARLGDTLTFTGHHLAGDSVSVRFAHPRLAAPHVVAPLGGGTDKTITYQVPNDPANWPAGFWTAAAVVTHGTRAETSNALPFALAPRITTPLPLSVNRDGSGNATVVLGAAPEVRPEQRVALLLGSDEIVAAPRTLQTDPLTFVVRAAVPGTYFVRLRVDGVDSLLIDYTAAPPAFIPGQQVTINP